MNRPGRSATTSQPSRDDLVRAVQSVRRRIKKAQESEIRLGEQNTKATLIEPILAALGWNLESVDDVFREYRRRPNDNPVDYALFMHRSPCLFIEAKSLKKDPSDRKWVSQTLGYATVVGVEWCVLTNGDEYRLYNSHAAVGVDEKLFQTVRISDMEHDAQVLDVLDLMSKRKMEGKQLSVLWQAHAVDRRVKAALEEYLADEASLVRALKKRAPDLKPSEIKASLKRAHLRVDYPALPSTPETPISRRRQAPGRATTERQSPKAASSAGVTLSDLIRARVITPPVQLKRRYKGVSLSATVRADGTVAFGGVTYNSLSTAAGMARKSVVGAPPGHDYPPTNGWTFWKYRQPGADTLIPIDAARQMYLRRQGT